MANAVESRSIMSYFTIRSGSVAASANSTGLASTPRSKPLAMLSSGSSSRYALFPRSLVMSSYENTGATRHDPSVTTAPSTTTSVSVCSSSPTSSSPIATFMSDQTGPATTTITTPPRSFESSLSLLAPPAAPRRRRHESQVQPSRSQISSVRRCLFGPLDPAQTHQDLESQLAEISQQQSERYNFDFEAGLPLPSTTGDRYEWSPSTQTTSQPPTEPSVVKESSTKQSVIDTSETPHTKTSPSGVGRAEPKPAASGGPLPPGRHPSTLMDHLPVISKPRTSSSRMPSHAGGVKRAHDEPATTSSTGRRLGKHEVTSTSPSPKRMRISSNIAQPATTTTTTTPSSSSSEEDC